MSKLIDAKTLPHLLRSMADTNGRAMSALRGPVVQPNYPARRVLDAVGQARHAETAIIDVIGNAEDALYGAGIAEYGLQPGSQRTCDSSRSSAKLPTIVVDDLIARNRGKDPVARLHIINVLARFNLPQVQQAIQRQLRQQQVHSRRRPVGAVPNGRTLRHAADMLDAEGTPRSSAEQSGRRVVKANLPETVKFWSTCSRTRTSTRARGGRVLNVVAPKSVNTCWK